MIGLSFNTSNGCTMRAPPPSTGSTRMSTPCCRGRAASARSATRARGGVDGDDLVASGSTRTPAPCCGPGSARRVRRQSAPSSHSASRHSWLHSPTRSDRRPVATRPPAWRSVVDFTTTASGNVPMTTVSLTRDAGASAVTRRVSSSGRPGIGTGGWPARSSVRRNASAIAAPRSTGRARWPRRR